ncbi:MMPL family transporter [Nocardia lijiangensis]|uniref:MMPL family transporter n=1 Tax=Nocardia lijiangensis TaxID=299618 RepID=UPI003D743543
MPFRPADFRAVRGNDRWQGSRGAVVFTGATVAIALLALAIVQIRLITTMAVTATGTVMIAVLAALTLLPAFAGPR